MNYYWYRGNRYETKDEVDDAIICYVGSNYNNMDVTQLKEYEDEWEQVEEHD